MSRIAIVVQRCHESIVGGSEALAWQYATLLKESYEVEVLTTTALDYAAWANALPEGTEVREQVSVRRFAVTTGRSPHWGKLYERLLSDFKDFSAERRQRLIGRLPRLPWSLALQEEFIRHQGPYSKPLQQFLREKGGEYRRLIFITYLYPTTYFGLSEVARARALFVPTLHDEPTAYLPAYRHAAQRAAAVIWLTEAERRLGIDLWGELPGRVVSMGIDTTLRAAPAAAPSDVPYILYCGRIDPNKGCPELFDYFIRFKIEHPSDLRLVLIGEEKLTIPRHPDIEYRGFASTEEKFQLMAGASVFVMPSANESFSIVTLEAMAQGTPVLASGGGEVLIEHVTKSSAGRTYDDYQSFAAALREMLADREKRTGMGAWAREYAVSNYHPDHIRTALIEVIEAADAPPSGAGGNGAGGDRPKPALRPAELPLPEAPPGGGYAPPSLLPMLPAGWSEPELRELVESIRVKDGPPEELRNYARADFRRFVYTLGLVPATPNLTLLELGANPYFTTTLLRKFRDLDLHLSNFFDGGEAAGAQDVTIHKTGETFTYPYKQFNIERDSFPYPDEMFDVVLCCEIIEHLLCDPVHALVEIRRILKDGGQLILTTPNVARLENVYRMIEGQNIYDPYSGYGAYGRHNREYNKHELFHLLTANGFVVETQFSADVHEGYAGSTAAAAAEVDRLIAFRRADLGQYIFSRSSVDGRSRHMEPVRPPWLYRSFHNESDPD